MITFLALAHMVAATQHHLSCTCTHGRCYATSWDGVGWGGVGDDNVPCTCTHGRCYATSTFLYLHTWSVLRNIIFLALAHLVAATQHHWNLPSLLYILIVSIIFCKSNKDILLVNLMCANFEFEFTLLKQSSRLGSHHASTAVPQNEMHVWLGVSHRCFQKAFVATLTHMLQEKKADCHVVRAPDSL